MDDEEETAVVTPVACRQDWEWVTHRSRCLERLPATLNLTGLESPATRTDRPDKYGQEVALVDSWKWA